MALAYRTGKNSNEAAKLKGTALTVQALFFTIIGASKLCTKIGTVMDLVISIGLMRVETMKDKPDPRASVAKVENLAAAVKRGRIAVAS